MIIGRGIYVGAILSALLFLSACESLKPSTLLNAGRAQQTFPSLALAVQDCVYGHPVRDEIVAPFNQLLDAWTMAADLKPDARLLSVLLNAQAEIETARDAWLSIRASIGETDLNCGPFVAAEVDNVETTFDELMAAIKSNERLIVAGQWAQVIGRIFLARPADVQRMVVGGI